MAHGRLSLGPRKWAWAAAAAVAAAGCQSVERDQGIGSLDDKTKAMLLTPAGGPAKAAEPVQFAATDPAHTGGAGVSARNAFNRGMAPNAAPAYAMVNHTATGSPAMPNTTGVVQASAVGIPTMPTTGGHMPLQPKAPAGPPVMPSGSPASPPSVVVIGRMPADPAPMTTPVVAAATVPPPPLAPAPVVVPPPAPVPVVLNPAPAALPPLQVTPPGPSTMLPPPLAATPMPMPPSGFAPLASPVDQPPSGLTPQMPAAIR